MSQARVGCRACVTGRDWSTKLSSQHVASDNEYDGRILSCLVLIH